MNTPIKITGFVILGSILMFTACQNNSDSDDAAIYSVTYNANGAESGSVPADSNKYAEDQVVTVAGNTGNLTKPGFSFSGWNTKSDDSGNTYSQGQSFVIGAFDVVLYARWTNNPIKLNWTEHIVGNPGGDYWSAIVSSDDGMRLAAASYDKDGCIYITDDGGETWDESICYAGSISGWVSLASSADGKILTACTEDGKTYVSEDYGETWSDRSIPAADIFSPWSASSSADGTTLALIVPYEGIYMSNNYGIDWDLLSNPTEPDGYWAMSIAISADGSVLAITSSGYMDNYLYISEDSGVIWTKQEGAGFNFWNSIDLSADGTKIIANGVDVLAYPHTPGIYIGEKTDSGGWFWKEKIDGYADSPVAVSADGTYYFALDENGYISASTNRGGTWHAHEDAGIRYWSSIVSSSNGKRLAAAVYGGHIYIGKP